MFEAQSGELKITDFGIARLTDAGRTRTGIVLGTPSFMSPEQLQGRAVTGRSDLFSLGVTLYQMLTGQLPYAGQSVAEVLEQHRRARTPRLPDRLLRFQPLLERLLAKRPPERLHSASAFLEALATASAGASSRSPTR
jgi:serine/threonine-protein kinase